MDFMKLFYGVVILILTISCDVDLGVGDPDDPNEMEEFTLLGTWELEEVTVAATIDGLSDTDSDDDPSGKIIFLAGGIGTTSYGFTVFSIPNASAGSFTWTRTDDLLTIVENGETQSWELKTMEADLIIAEWTDFLDEDEDIVADFTIKLSK